MQKSARQLNKCAVSLTGWEVWFIACYKMQLLQAGRCLKLCWARCDTQHSMRELKKIVGEWVHGQNLLCSSDVLKYKFVYVRGAEAPRQTGCQLLISSGRHPGEVRPVQCNT